MALLPPRHLVIDGQQRIRSIWDALAVTENATDLDMENSAEADGREIWCLNIMAGRTRRSTAARLSFVERGTVNNER